jgi:small-conductance mechanosensitive channel
MKQYLSIDTIYLLIQTAILIGVLLIIYAGYRYLFAWVSKRVLKTESEMDDQILKLFNGPLLLLIFWFVTYIFIQIYYRDSSIFGVLVKISNLLLIFNIAWLSARFVSAAAYYLQSRYDLITADNLKVKKSLTQIKVFRAIAVTIITIIALGAGLMIFEQARKAGISVLTAAGIMVIIVGFAAQKSLGMFLAGIQLAITQPIRIDDIVIVDGEFGRIEEIQLTYVVVQIWDERRMIFPVTWFLDKPFQNLTRSGTS